jgi:hypothetical protein
LKILEIHQMVSFIVRPGFASRKMLIALGEISYKGIKPRCARHAHHMSQFAPNVISRDLAPLERPPSEARLPPGLL